MINWKLITVPIYLLTFYYYFCILSDLSMTLCIVLKWFWTELPLMRNTYIKYFAWNHKIIYIAYILFFIAETKDYNIIIMLLYTNKKRPLYSIRIRFFMFTSLPIIIINDAAVIGSCVRQLDIHQCLLYLNYI